ncbi:hypothetical protein [Bosea sp. ANAM02]|uniref:hypothetical protein n=1 Tax=Bosea sp. ANAM02 TaxID=2020412 RepID=UPI00140EF305|nr:hypothetical protein [Bosea sp. ANAM02]BCB22214.1 hypothetical protein OCUBac02_51080 [Bosea sp. ANAM02]
MRIHFTSTTHCAHLAKSLKRLLAPTHDIKLSAAQNAVGRMMGYRNWQELASASVIGVTPSPVDDDVSELERKSRAMHHVSCLQDAFGLSPAQATQLVAELRPTGRRGDIPVQGKEPWRKRFDEMTATPGLPGAVEGATLDMMKEDIARFDDGKWTVSRLPDGLELHLWIAPQNLEGSSFRLDEVTGIVVKAGKPIVYAQGLLFWLKEPRFFRDFKQALVWSCDQYTGEFMCDVLKVAEGDPDYEDRLDTEASFFLNLWKRDFTETSKGDGLALLVSMQAAYKKRTRRRLDWRIELPAEPDQFDDVDFDKRAAFPDYQRARKHLIASISELLTPASLRFNFFDRAAADAARCPNDLSGLTAHIPSADLGEPDLSPFARTLQNTIAYLREAIVEWPAAEFPVMTPDEWPADFDLRRASRLLNLSPDSTLWQRMPSDLMKIVIEPDPEQVGTTRPGLVLRFRFSNGTELSMPSRYIVGGDLWESALPQLVAQGDMFVRKTPFTSKFNPPDLQRVLSIHSLLLFDGRSDASVPIDQPVEVIRSAAPTGR